MEQVLPELLKQGVVGLVAGIFFWLYMTERKEHKETRKEKDLLQNQRLTDAKETVDKVSQPLSGISQTMTLIYDKLKASKEA